MCSLGKISLLCRYHFFLWVIGIGVCIALPTGTASAAPAIAVVMTQGTKIEIFDNNSPSGSNNFMTYNTDFVAGVNATRSPTTIFLALPGTPSLPYPDPSVAGGYCAPSNFPGNGLDGCTYGFTISESVTRIDPTTGRGFLDFWFVGPGFVNSLDFNNFRQNSLYPVTCAGCGSYLNQAFPDTMANGFELITPYLIHPVFGSVPGVGVALFVVPEPASLLMLGIALAALVALQRRAATPSRSRPDETMVSAG